MKIDLELSEEELMLHNKISDIKEKVDDVFHLDINLPSYLIFKMPQPDEIEFAKELLQEEGIKPSQDSQKKEPEKKEPEKKEPEKKEPEKNEPEKEPERNMEAEKREPPHHPHGRRPDRMDQRFDGDRKHPMNEPFVNTQQSERNWFQIISGLSFPCLILICCKKKLAKFSSNHPTHKF